MADHPPRSEVREPHRQVGRTKRRDRAADEYRPSSRAPEGVDLCDPGAGTECQTADRTPARGGRPAFVDASALRHPRALSVSGKHGTSKRAHNPPPATPPSPPQT